MSSGGQFVVVRPHKLMYREFNSATNTVSISVKGDELIQLMDPRVMRNSNNNEIIWKRGSQMVAKLNSTTAFYYSKDITDSAEEDESMVTVMLNEEFRRFDQTSRSYSATLNFPSM